MKCNQTAPHTVCVCCIMYTASSMAFVTTRCLMCDDVLTSATSHIHMSGKSAQYVKNANTQIKRNNTIKHGTQVVRHDSHVAMGVFSYPTQTLKCLPSSVRTS